VSDGAAGRGRPIHGHRTLRRLAVKVPQYVLIVLVAAYLGARRVALFRMPTPL
jgi:hypothetical protein